MATETKIILEWHGDEVKRRADNLAKHTPYEIGLAVEGQAKLLAPVETGRLRASITTASGDGKRTSPSGKGSVSSDKISPPNNPNETFVGTPVQYGPYQEYGTVRMAAQPFLRPALEMIKNKVLGITQNQAKKDFGEYLNPKGIFAQTNEAFTE